MLFSLAGCTVLEAENGEPALSWLQIGIQTNIEWPIFETTVVFLGSTFVLRPPSAYHSPAILLEYSEGELEKARTAISEFMSVLAWLKRQRIVSVSGFAYGPDRPAQIGPAPVVQNITDKFDCRFFPDLSHANARRALAFFRDGLQNPNVSQAFLSYWKIPCLVARERSDKHTKLLLDKLSQLRSSEAKERLASLVSSGFSLEDIVEKHLYGARRCAIAHTDGMNPDDAGDLDAVESDICLVYALAEAVIEHDLGVKSESLLYSERGLTPPLKSYRALHTASNQILNWVSGPIVMDI